MKTIPFVRLTHHAVPQAKGGHGKLYGHEQVFGLLDDEKLRPVIEDAFENGLVNNLRKIIVKYDVLKMFDDLFTRGFKQPLRRMSCLLKLADDLVVKLD